MYTKKKKTNVDIVHFITDVSPAKYKGVVAQIFAYMYVFSIINVMQCYYMSGLYTCRQMDWMKGGARH